MIDSTDINEVMQRVMSDMSRSQIFDTDDFMFYVHANDAAALVDEIKSLRATLLDIKSVWDDTDNEDPNKLLNQIGKILKPALNTSSVQPAPQAWAPKVGDTVRTTWSGAICKVANTHSNRSLVVSVNGIEGWINNSELEPFTE